MTAGTNSNFAAAQLMIRTLLILPVLVIAGACAGCDESPPVTSRKHDTVPAKTRPVTREFEPPGGGP